MIGNESMGKKVTLLLISGGNLYGMVKGGTTEILIIDEIGQEKR